MYASFSFKKYHGVPKKQKSKKKKKKILFHKLTFLFRDRVEICWHHAPSAAQPLQPGLTVDGLS
jgi:hypothetical protein